MRPTDLTVVTVTKRTNDGNEPTRWPRESSGLTTRHLCSQAHLSTRPNVHDPGDYLRNTCHLTTELSESLYVVIYSPTKRKRLSSHYGSACWKRLIKISFSVCHGRKVTGMLKFFWAGHSNLNCVAVIRRRICAFVHIQTPMSTDEYW